MISLTPHDVIGKMPRIEGTIFTAQVGKLKQQFKLIRITDNRLICEPV